MPSQATSGFAGGFVRGLANVLNTKRQEATRVKERREGQARDALQFLVDSDRVKDFSDLEPLMEQAGWVDSTTKGKKPKAGEPDTRAVLSQVLGPIFQQGGGAAGPDAGPSNPFSPRPIPEDQPATTNPFSPRPMEAAPQAGPAAGTSVMGVPLMSPEEAATQKVNIQGAADDAMLTQKMGRARTILPALRELDPKATIWDAMKAVGLDINTLRSSATASAPRFGGYMTGAQLPAGTLDSFGREVDPKQRYRISMLPGGEFEYIPSEDRMVNAGAQMNAAAIRMGYKSAAEVPPDKQPELEATAERMTKELREAGAYGTGTGAGQANFEKPADLTEAQATGVDVGVSAADVEGQKVPSEAQRIRRTTADNIKQQLDHIKGLLTPLPKKGELGGLAPGASLTIRRRTPQYREAFAKLESAINNIRASLTRTMQQNVGAETERDAERALSTIADFEGSLFDPLKGDTQESAAARLDETIAYLDQVMSGMATAPVPKDKETTPPAGAAETISGFTMKDGKLHLNGKPVE